MGCRSSGGVVMGCVVVRGCGHQGVVVIKGCSHQGVVIRGWSSGVWSPAGVVTRGVVIGGSSGGVVIRGSSGVCGHQGVWSSGVGWSSGDVATGVVWSSGVPPTPLLTLCHMAL